MQETAIKLESKLIAGKELWRQWHDTVESSQELHEGSEDDRKRNEDSQPEKEQTTGTEGNETYYKRLAGTAQERTQLFMKLQD